MLQENHLNYHKSIDYKNLRPMFGDGLVTSEGERWKRQRRLAQPAFHRQRLGATVSVMTRRTDEILQHLDAFARSGEAFDLHAQMSALALLIVSEVLFGTDLSGDVARVGPEVSRILEILTHRMRTLWQLVPIWVPTPKSVRFLRSRALLDRIVNDLIAARRRRTEGPATDDLLAMLMEARDADDGRRHERPPAPRRGDDALPGRPRDDRQRADLDVHAARGRPGASTPAFAPRSTRLAEAGHRGSTTCRACPSRRG